MLTVLCVLRSGGAYDETWVRKLRDGVARNLSVAHRFAALSDVEVPCERIPLVHDWPGWWSKIEAFRPGVVTDKTLYLDLDTVIVGNLDRLAELRHPFAMLRGFGRRHYVGSGVMWFGRPQVHVYEQFLAGPPERLIAEYAANPGPGAGRHRAFNAARGDQAYIFDAMGGDRNIARLTDDVPGMIQLYAKQVHDIVPSGCSVVCFKGKSKPNGGIAHAWMREHWR